MITNSSQIGQIMVVVVVDVSLMVVVADVLFHLVTDSEQMMLVDVLSVMCSLVTVVVLYFKNGPFTVSFYFIYIFPTKS